MLLEPEKIYNAPPPPPGPAPLRPRLRRILCLPVSNHTVSVRSERSRIRRSTIVCQSAFRFPPGVPAERRAADGDVCRESLRDIGGPESLPEVESRPPAAFRKPQGVREVVGQLGAATEKAAVTEIPPAKERKSHPRPQCYFPIIQCCLLKLTLPESCSLGRNQADLT